MLYKTAHPLVFLEASILSSILFLLSLLHPFIPFYLTPLPVHFLPLSSLSLSLPPINPLSFLSLSPVTHQCIPFSLPLILFSPMHFPFTFPFISPPFLSLHLFIHPFLPVFLLTLSTPILSFPTFPYILYLFSLSSLIYPSFPFLHSCPSCGCCCCCCVVFVCLASWD